MPKKQPEMERVGDILEHSLKRLDLSPRITEYGVWPIWDEIVGATIARNAQPEKVRNGTLFVKVTSPVWMQQLQYVKEMIIEKLNQSVGGDVVKHIFFFVGKLDVAPGNSTTESPLAMEAPPRAQSESRDECLESIKDPETRRAFKRLFSAYARRGKR